MLSPVRTSIAESYSTWLDYIKTLDSLGAIKPTSRIPFLADIRGGQIINPPFSDGQGVRALDLVNNLIYHPWRHQGTWRTETVPKTADSNGELTLEVTASSLHSGTVISHVPFCLIHVSPQLVQGVGNARYSIRIRHPIDNQRKVDYKFEVLPEELDATVLYLGADTVDTVAVHKGITIGNEVVSHANTTAAKSKLTIDCSGLPENSQGYVEIPSRDHPLVNNFIDRVLSFLGQTNEGLMK